MLGGLLRKRRLENALFVRELVSLIGVTGDTIINWEKGRTYPCQKHVLLLKEHLKIDPFDLADLRVLSHNDKNLLSILPQREGQLQEENANHCLDYESNMPRMICISYIDWDCRIER